MYDQQIEGVAERERLNNRGTAICLLVGEAASYWVLRECQRCGIPIRREAEELHARWHKDTGT